MQKPEPKQTVAPKRRVAILVELPHDAQRDDGIRALRMLLKHLLRRYGLKCLSVRPPEDTVTFKDMGVKNDK